MAEVVNKPPPEGSSGKQLSSLAMASVCRGLQALLSEETLCDLKVTVGAKTFHCHLLVMCSVSGFFRSMASSAWRERNTGKLTIEHEDVTPQSFQMLMDVVYGSEDVVSLDTATSVLSMSIFLQVSFLEQYCTQFLMDNMTPEVCVGIWMFAEKYHLTQLAHRASAMASDDISKVVDSEEVLQLPLSMLLVVLGSQKTLTMDATCRTLLRWVQHDPGARQQSFQYLLPFVSFPQLSPAYIHELMAYFDHPFFQHISKKIREAVSFNLMDQTPEVKQKLLGQQSRVRDDPALVRKCAVILGASGNPQTPQSLTAFYMEPGIRFYSFALKNCPQPLGAQFAACVHGNQLYVSQVNERKTSLMKYMPGSNEWKTLPPLSFALEKHSMCGVGDRVYLVGGSTKRKNNKKHSVSYYDLLTESWTKNAGHLRSDGVEGASSAVLGHRIYVFGGKDGAGGALKTVQCVDTRSGQTYVAGEMTSEADDVMALSDGGSIFLLCDGKRVLRMKEFFELADSKERSLERPAMMAGGEATQSPTAGNTNPSVTLAEVGSFGDKTLSAAVLYNGLLIGCGAASGVGGGGDGNVPIDVTTMAMTLSTGDETQKRLAFPKLSPTTTFLLLALNIPKDFLDEKKAAAQFQVNDYVLWKPTVPCPTRYQQYNYSYSGNGYVQLQTTEIGQITSINADGTVTTAFPQFGSHASPPSSLRFR